MSDPTSVPTDEIVVDLPETEEVEPHEQPDHPGADTLGELDWDGEGPLRWASKPDAA